MLLCANITFQIFFVFLLYVTSLGIPYFKEYKKLSFANVFQIPEFSCFVFCQSPLKCSYKLKAQENAVECYLRRLLCALRIC